MPTKPTRWLDLIAFLLQHRYPVSREDIYSHVRGYLADPAAADEKARQSARRKFERDKDELRGLGIEIETVEIPDAPGDEASLGYRLRPVSFYLPYLELEGESTSAERRPYPGLQRMRLSREDMALLDRATRRVAERGESPLANAARSARRKLEFDLPLPMAAVERILGAPMDDEGSRSLELLQRGAAEHTAVRCRYYGIGRDQEEPREIEPYGLFFSWGRWYCVARGRLRNALRVFRVDRMRDARLMTGPTARFDVPPDFDIRHYLNRSPWELSSADPVHVRVRFGFPESRWVQARGVGRVIDPVLEDAGAILEFDVRDPNPFLRWLLTFRRQVQVLSPEDIARQLDELRRQVAGLYDPEAATPATPRRKTDPGAP